MKLQRALAGGMVVDADIKSLSPGLTVRAQLALARVFRAW